PPCWTFAVVTQPGSSRCSARSLRVRRRNGFLAVAGAERAVDERVDRVAQEADRAVAEQEVGAAFVLAAEAAVGVGGRLQVERVGRVHEAEVVVLRPLPLLLRIAARPDGEGVG